MGLLDANSAGFIHGGTVMKLCDEAAGLAAIRHSRCRVVTAGMDRMTFLTPIHVGELVTFQASVNAVWRTSMEVGVRVDTEDPRTGESRHSNSAYLTMVAVDEQGRPVAGPADRARRPTPSTAARRRRNCGGPTGWPSATRSAPGAERAAPRTDAWPRRRRGCRPAARVRGR